MAEIEFFVGFDVRMPEAYAVTVRSLVKQGAKPHDIHPIVLPHLQGLGLYNRPMQVKDGVLFDDISDYAMASEFAISRFFTPFLGKKKWAVFVDSDFLFRKPVAALEKLLDPQFALMCVPHDYSPLETTKMRGQIQGQYNRKNWSSLMAFHRTHPSNDLLTPHMINTLPGRDLHRFCWLNDNEIGALADGWNWLEGHATSPDPAAVHFTRGTPDMPGYETAVDGVGHATIYADEWRQLRSEVALCQSGI